MSTDAQIAANRINAQASTGPTSATGQARGNAEPVRPYPRSTEPERSASGRALSSELYSSGDFVRPEEQELYAHFCVGFWADLAPEGAIEQTLSAEIIHAAWRLRRCSAIEAMTCSNEGELDPLLDRAQQAVDRARAQAHRLFHRTTAELRRLQTERRFRTEFLDEDFDTSVLGLASYKDMAPLLTTLRSTPTDRPTVQPQASARGTIKRPRLQASRQTPRQ